MAGAVRPQPPYYGPNLTPNPYDLVGGPGGVRQVDPRFTNPQPAFDATDPNQARLTREAESRGVADVAQRRQANPAWTPPPAATASWQEQAAEQQRVGGEDQARQTAASRTALANMETDRQRRGVVQSPSSGSEPAGAFPWASNRGYSAEGSPTQSVTPPRPSLEALIAAADRLSGPEPPPYVPPDPNAVNAAGFARAKDQIGQVGRASLNTLRNVASARGISGSRYEGGQMARLVEHTQGQLDDTLRDQAGKTYDVNADASRLNWQAQQDRPARRRASLAMLAQLRPGGVY